MTNHCNIYQWKLQIKTPFSLSPLRVSITQDSGKNEVFKILVIHILYVLNLGNGNDLQGWMQPVCSTVRPNKGSIRGSPSPLSKLDLATFIFITYKENVPYPPQELHQLIPKGCISG